MKKLRYLVLMIMSVTILMLVAACSQPAPPTNNQVSASSTEVQEPIENTAEPQQTEPVAEPQPASAGSINPDDYWVSEDVYDLVGFMEACGYYWEEIDNGYNCETIKFVSHYYGENRKIIFNYHFYNSPTRVDLVVLLKDKVYSASNATNNKGDDGRLVNFTGEYLQDRPPISRTYFVDLLVAIPLIDQNLDGRHCPFYGSVGAPFDHTEEDRSSGETKIHFTHLGWEDKGYCN